MEKVTISAVDAGDAAIVNFDRRCKSPALMVTGALRALIWLVRRCVSIRKPPAFSSRHRNAAMDCPEGVADFWTFRETRIHFGLQA
ncbi:MAG TPA: hypothetical protein VGE57_04770 [Solimonas sp.]